MLETRNVYACKLKYPKTMKYLIINHFNLIIRGIQPVIYYVASVRLKHRNLLVTLRPKFTPAVTSQKVTWKPV